MAVGIDVGTGFCVSARQEDSQIVYKPFRDAFLKLDSSNDFTKKIMAQTNANFISKGSDIYIIGEEAIDFASLLNKEIQRPLSSGVISSTEKEAQNILEIILQTIAGAPKKENEILYFSVPAPSVDVSNDIIFHEFTLANIYESIGYKAKAINEGLAVVYSELGSEQLTGIGISFGAGQANLCLSLMGAPIVQFSVARSGDYIDNSVAKACGITANKARIHKEKGIDLSQSKFATREEAAIQAYYKHLIEYVISNFKQEFEKNGNTKGFDKAIPVILSGGTSLPKGFDILFEQILSKSDFPLNISEVRRAADPLNAVAKGCLIAAISDES